MVGPMSRLPGDNRFLWSPCGIHRLPGPPVDLADWTLDGQEGSVREHQDDPARRRARAPQPWQMPQARMIPRVSRQLPLNDSARERGRRGDRLWGSPLPDRGWRVGIARRRRTERPLRPGRLPVLRCARRARWPPLSGTLTRNLPKETSSPSETAERPAGVRHCLRPTGTPANVSTTRCTDRAALGPGRPAASPR